MVAQRLDVVVLYQDAVAQVAAVVVAAAAAHGVLVQRAQARRGLAGVDYAHVVARHGVDVAARGGGDAAHALHEVERGALGHHDGRR